MVGHTNIHVHMYRSETVVGVSPLLTGVQTQVGIFVNLFSPDQLHF